MNAFNNRTSITINGITYNFSNCIGTFHFLLCGHLHIDSVETENNIPIIYTRRMDIDSETSLDLCYADFTNAQLHIVRVGLGESR